MGRVLRVRARGQDETSIVNVEIVGVVESPKEPAVFLPAPLEIDRALSLYIRSNGPATQLAPAVRELVDAVDSRVPIIERRRLTT